MIPSRWVAYLIACVLGLVVGLGAGWKLWRGSLPKVETYAPAQRQKDGSLVLERKPDAQAKPAQELPKGAKLERVVQVTVQPKALQALPEIQTHGSGPNSDPLPGPRPPCPPVRVDLSLVRMPDESRRVIASSPDGEVVGGVDIPVEAAKPAPKPLRWAAGGLWNPADRTYGAWLQRNTGPFVIGVQTHQERLPIQAGGRTSLKAEVMIGIRW